MFIQVRLLKGFQEPLIYQVPDSWNDQALIGKLVKVPIQSQIRSALVIDQYAQKPDHITFSIKQALSIDPFPDDIHYKTFIKQLSDYYALNSLYFIKRIQQFLVEKEIQENTPDNQEVAEHQNNVILSDEQQRVVDFLTPYIINPTYVPTLVHGVTGSGKTEIYKNLIIKNFHAQKTSLLLLPEVTLSLQFEKLLRAQLPESITLFGFHSGTSAKQKKILWQCLLNNQPIVIIGVHLPILLPIANLGIIIIDEEHETGYQEKKHPKINTKEAAIMRAHNAKIPIILGSATPSVASLHNVQKRGWHFFTLKKRFAGSFPTVRTMFLNDKQKNNTKNTKRKNFWITRELELAIADRLEKNEQIIIFLNRRGFSFFVQCKACSFIFQCSNCSVSLTLHGTRQLTCHYCAYTRSLPTACPNCHVSEEQFLKKGIGTQQIVSILQSIFSQARIARADMDTTSKKKEWQQTMIDFADGSLDILVGTQTISKGYHFPNVTLVGIIWADLNLHFPTYNAAETTLQQLIQVAGRAGRQKKGSEVIVQTMIDHSIFNYLNELDYPRFFEREIETRSLVSYPPCIRFAEIELKHDDEYVVETDAQKALENLFTINNKFDMNLIIMGPAKPPISKVKNSHARKIYLKGERIQDIIAAYKKLSLNYFKSRLYFCPNPVA
jgi:primosomal protein N' (replication factor Y)